jgi:hypothetical protein
MRNVSDETCRENQNTRFMFDNFFFPQNHAVCDNVEKYCRAGQAADDNMAHALCVLDK